MMKILGSVIIAVLGLASINHGMNMMADDYVREGFILFAPAAQIVAFILMLYGLRQFFLDNIIAEIKKLTARDPLVPLNAAVTALNAIARGERLPPAQDPQPQREDVPPSEPTDRRAAE